MPVVAPASTVAVPSTHLALALEASQSAGEGPTIWDVAGDGVADGLKDPSRTTGSQNVKFVRPELIDGEAT